jgi:activator-of-BECN1-regulated-autophagy protein 1
LHMIRLEFAIISLSFHPSGKVLAIANGTRLHFWSLENTTLNNNNNTNTNNTNDDAQQRQQQQQQQQPQGNRPRGMLTEVEQRHMLRCVHFPPNGNTIIVGGVNPTTDANRPRRGGISGGGMSFYLRLWDFDLQAALHHPTSTSLGEPTMGLRRRAISNVS